MAKFSHYVKHFCCRSAFLLHDNGMLLPLKPQTFETGFQSGIFWKRNLISGCTNWQITKLMTAVTTLMLTLAQVHAFHSSRCQTLIKHSTVHRKQVEYDDSLLRNLKHCFNGKSALSVSIQSFYTDGSQSLCSKSLPAHQEKEAELDLNLPKNNSACGHTVASGKRYNDPVVCSLRTAWPWTSTVNLKLPPLFPLNLWPSVWGETGVCVLWLFS